MAKAEMKALRECRKALDSIAAKIPPVSDGDRYVTSEAQMVDALLDLLLDYGATVEDLRFETSYSRPAAWLSALGPPGRPSMSTEPTGRPGRGHRDVGTIKRRGVLYLYAWVE